jgi:uncharacterized membrane protein YfcA
MFSDLTPVSWAVSALCVILIGIAKAGFAGGIGVVATPLLSLVMTPTKAAAVLLPLLCGSDVVSIYFYRRLYCWRNLRELLPGAVAGILLGAVFLSFWAGDQETAERQLKAVIGWISLLFVLYQAARAWILKKIERYHPKGWHGWLFGSCSGFVSTLAHAGGPPITMYLLPQHLDRQVFVGTTVWFFTIINALKLVPYGFLGLFPKENLALSFALMPLVPLGVGMGVWLNRHTREHLFVPLVHGILFLTGIQLITGWNPIGLLMGFFRG